MKYEITKDKIIIYDKTQFNSKHILECGQIFRYKQLSNEHFIVYSADKFAEIIEHNNYYEIITADINYFENFFDLKTDYSKIKSSLVGNQTLKNACEYGYGIRILNQQPLETIISFIISANNNIKRIQTLVEKLCEQCGENKGLYYAFPSLSQLKNLSVEDLKNLGMGFRAKYIYYTVRQLEYVDLEKLKNLDTLKLLEFLTSLSGVGPKVADCIALFSYHKMDCFPVDTWVQKIYNCYFSINTEKNRNIIRNNLVSNFKNLSGYAQQYLFYYKRELDRLSHSIKKII